jgi:hypothetical protein
MEMYPDFLYKLPEIDTSPVNRKGDIIVNKNTNRKGRRTTSAETTKKVEYITKPNLDYLFTSNGHCFTDRQSSYVRTSIGIADK